MIAMWMESIALHTQSVYTLLKFYLIRNFIYFQSMSKLLLFILVEPCNLLNLFLP